MLLASRLFGSQSPPVSRYICHRSCQLALPRDCCRIDSKHVLFFCRCTAQFCKYFLVATMTMDSALKPPAFLHVGVISPCCNSRISSIFTSTGWLNLHKTAGPSGLSPRSTILLCEYLPPRRKNPDLLPDYLPSANPNKIYHSNQPHPHG